MVDATFLVLMQAGRPGDWSDLGVPEALAGYTGGEDPRAVGLDWLFEQAPEGDNWRVLVWADAQSADFDHDKPTVVLTVADYAGRASGPVGESGRVLRAGRRRHRTRIAVPPGRMVHKVQVGRADLLGAAILVTQRRANTSARTCPGPWFPAREPGPDTVAAWVTGRGEMSWRGEDVVSLRTSVGELAFLAPQQGVIPVDES